MAPNQAALALGLGVHGVVQDVVPESLPLDFQRVYQEHARFVFRVLRGMGVFDSLAEDAVQDVFIVVHRKLSDFEAGGALRGWLFQIALHVARDYRRKQKRLQQQMPLAEDLAHQAQGPFEVSVQAETVRSVLSALERLSDDQRAVLVLSDMEGLSAPEIAEVMQLPLSNVYTRLRRARIAFDGVWSTLQKKAGA